MWWRVARRGPASPGPAPPGSAVTAGSVAPTPHLCREDRDGDDEGRTGTDTRSPRHVPAPLGPGPPRRKRGNPEGTGCPTVGKGREGLPGCGGDPAPAPQLLFSSLTSGRRQQLGTYSSEAGLASSCRQQHCPRTEGSNHLLEK